MVAKVILAVALVLVVGVAATADQDVKEFLAKMEASMLYAACAPVPVTVGIKVEGVEVERLEGTRLTTEAIEDTVELRLRGVRLFAASFEGSKQFLDVSVNAGASVYGTFVFTVELNLYRFLDNLGYGMPGIAVVWFDSVFGRSRESNGQFVLDSATGLMEKFLLKYLRANESACSR